MHLNDEKGHTVTILQLNMVHLDARKIFKGFSFLIIYTSYNDFEKKCWEDVLIVITKSPLTGYFRATMLWYSQRFEDVYETLINIENAYFLASLNKVSNIIALETKVLYLKLFTNQKQVLRFAIGKETRLNLLKDLLTFSNCIPKYLISEIKYSARFQD